MILCLRNCTYAAQWLHALTGYQEPGAGWMPSAQYISADVGREMTEKHHRHHSSVSVSCFLVINVLIVAALI